MIRGEIQIVATTQDEMRIALEVLSRMVAGSCRLDVPEGVHEMDEDLMDSKIRATFRVLPEYQDGDLEKFFGCWPDLQPIE